MSRVPLIGGEFEDFEGQPLTNGYLVLRLSEDAQTGTAVPDTIALSSGVGSILLEDGSGLILLETSQATATTTNPLFLLQEDGAMFSLEDDSGFIELELDETIQGAAAQITAGTKIRINLDMLGNIAGTAPGGIFAVIGASGYGVGGYGEGSYGSDSGGGIAGSDYGQGGYGAGGYGGGSGGSGGSGSSVSSIPNTPSVWANDNLVPNDTVYIVNAYKYDGTRVWKTPQLWTIPSFPSPFDVGSFGIFPATTPTPNIVDVLPSLLGIIPGSRVIPGTGDALLLQINGVNNGNQAKLNLQAGTGMTITDDLLGNITFAAALGSGNAPLIVTTASTNGTLTYGATPWKVELGTSGAGGITRTLPTAIGNVGAVFILKKVDAGVGTLTVAATGGQTIDSGSNWLITNQFQWLAVTSDGSNWQIFSAN